MENLENYMKCFREMGPCISMLTSYNGSFWAVLGDGKSVHEVEQSLLKPEAGKQFERFYKDFPIFPIARSESPMNAVAQLDQKIGKLYTFTLKPVLKAHSSYTMATVRNGISFTPGWVEILEELTLQFMESNGYEEMLRSSADFYCFNALRALSIK